MKKRGKFITAIVTVTVLFVLNLAGCGYADYLSKSEISTKADNTVMKEKIKNNEPETLPAAAGGEIVLGSATELNNFDPFTSVTADVRSVNFNIFEGHPKGCLFLLIYKVLKKLFNRYKDGGKIKYL